MLKSKKLWVGLALSLALMAFFFRSIDLAELGQALAGARWAWVLPAILLYIATYAGRARRITQILAPVQVISPSRALPPLLIGFMFNNVLPGRLGELVFAFLLGKREGLSRAAALAAVLLSRILDGISVLAFFLLGLLAFPALSANIRWVGLSGSLIFGCALAGCLGLVFWREQSLSLLRKALAFLPERPATLGLRFVEGFVGGLGILQKPAALLAVALLNFVPWTMELGVYWLVARAFELPLGLLQCSLVMGLCNLAMLLPSAPGGIGLFQAGGLMALALWGLPPAACLAYLLVLHAVILVPVNIGGAYCLWREGISFSGTLHAVEERS